MVMGTLPHITCKKAFSLGPGCQKTLYSKTSEVSGFVTIRGRIFFLHHTNSLFFLRLRPNLSPGDRGYKPCSLLQPGSGALPRGGESMLSIPALLSVYYCFLCAHLYLSVSSNLYSSRCEHMTRPDQVLLNLFLRRHRSSSGLEL